MVDRFEEKKLTPAVIVDLDGTLVDGNSLRIYIKCGFADCLRSWRLRDAAVEAMYLAARALRLISHTTMKSKLLKVLRPNERLLERFGSAVRRRINPAVSALIERERKVGHRVLLATASPDCYIPTIWEGEFVATQFSPGEVMKECRGEEKLRRVNQWLAENSCCMYMVVSDHSDDLPLVAGNRTGINVLVKPDRRSLSLFRKLKPAHLLLIDDVDKLGVTC